VNPYREADGSITYHKIGGQGGGGAGGEISLQDALGNKEMMLDWLQQQMKKRPELFGGMLGDGMGAMGASRGGRTTEPTGFPKAFVAPEGTIPEAFDAQPGAVKGGGSVGSVVAASRPLMEEAVNRATALAAQKAFAGGKGRSGGYMKELGNAARKGALDYNNIIANTVFKAAEGDASRRAAAEQALQNRRLQSWGRMGDWQNQANELAKQQAFNAWRTQGGWEQEATQRDADRNLAAQSQFNARYWPMIQGLMSSVMGGA